MNRPTDRRSIVTNLVWGILTICVIGSPGDASGQTDEGVVPPAVENGSWVVVEDGSRVIEARDVETLDVPTRLMWTLQMVFAPGALAHVSPLYAYDPQNLAGRTVYPDRIGHVATVWPCDAATTEQKFWTAGEVSWCANYWSDTIDAYNSAYRATIQLVAKPESDGQQPSDIVYFATTYPLPGIEPEKRFVVEHSR